MVEEMERDRFGGRKGEGRDLGEARKEEWNRGRYEGIEGSEWTAEQRWSEIDVVEGRKRFKGSKE